MKSNNALLVARAAQVISLRTLAVESGLTPSFDETEFNSMMESDLSDAEKERLVSIYHKGLHELLYAPPARR